MFHIYPMDGIYHLPQHRLVIKSTVASHVAYCQLIIELMKSVNDVVIVNDVVTL